MDFIDFEKAFDRVQLEDVLYLLYNRQIPYKLMKTIENVHASNQIQTKVKGEFTESIPVDGGIRQGDSISLFLLKTIMDEIIRNIGELKGYII